MIHLIIKYFTIAFTLFNYLNIIVYKVQKCMKTIGVMLFLFFYFKMPCLILCYGQFLSDFFL